MYQYEIKKIGPEKRVIVYLNNNIIFEGEPSFSASEETLFEKALLALEGTYPDIRGNIRRKGLTKKYVYDITIINQSNTSITVYQVNESGNLLQIYSGYAENENYAITNAITNLQDTYPDINQMELRKKTDQTAGLNLFKKKNESLQSETGITSNLLPAGFDDLIDKKNQLTDTIKSIQTDGFSTAKIGEQIWKNLIEPRLLTEKQIIKKIVMLTSSSSPIPITEEYAQLIVYGKVYDRKPEEPNDSIGELWDNDRKDPSCIATPEEEDYQPPIYKSHPMYQKVETMLKDIKEALIQLGIKLAEFIMAIPAAITTMISAFASLVSSILILPWGSGIPTALTAVQTMIKTIKDLQSKTAELLPHLGIINLIGLILPKTAQIVISQINAIFVIFMGILTAILGILSILKSITIPLEKLKKKAKDAKLEIKLKAEPEIITTSDGSSILSVEASNGDWQYKYKWTDEHNHIIPKDINDEDDEGKRTVKPLHTTIYTCRVTDGSGSSKEKTITIIVDKPGGGGDGGSGPHAGGNP